MTVNTTKIDQAARAILKRDDANRLEAAREQARQELLADQAGEERARVIHDAQHQLQSMDLGLIERAREKAAAALDAYAAAIDGWNDTISTLAGSLSAIDEQDVVVRDRGTVTVRGVTGRPIGLQRSFAALATEVIRAHQPHGYISLDTPPD
jgi:threonine dehydrogenase-like Zn-dependent dehydrogenase